MTNLDVSDIQGFAVRGYNFPYARFLLLELGEPAAVRVWLNELLKIVTTAERWDVKPMTTVNIAFTHPGLIRLDLPLASLLSFPLEFQQGMKARGLILGDTGANAPERWDAVWREGRVHAWLAINAREAGALDDRSGAMHELMQKTGGASLLQSQDAGAISLGGKFTSKEHFGYTDGFGNPDFLGVERDSIPGQGKLTSNGGWEPLAAGEFLLGYADEAGELPVAPIPHLLARNGAFMVYRKLHQNVAAFRAYLEEKGAQYPGGKERLAAKFVGRWRDGTPSSFRPPNPTRTSSPTAASRPTSPTALISPGPVARWARTSAAPIRATPPASPADWSIAGASCGAACPTASMFPKANRSATPTSAA